MLTNLVPSEISYTSATLPGLRRFKKPWHCQRFSHGFSIHNPLKHHFPMVFPWFFPWLEIPWFSNSAKWLIELAGIHLTGLAARFQAATPPRGRKIVGHGENHHFSCGDDHHKPPMTGNGKHTNYLW